MADGSRPWAARTTRSPLAEAHCRTVQWSLLAEKLAALLGPSLPALGQSIFLLVGHRAALRELCCQWIGCHVGRRGVSVCPSSPRSRIAQAATTRTTSTTAAKVGSRSNVFVFISETSARLWVDSLGPASGSGAVAPCPGPERRHAARDSRFCARPWAATTAVRSASCWACRAKS